MSYLTSFTSQRLTSSLRALVNPSTNSMRWFFPTMFSFTSRFMSLAPRIRINRTVKRPKEQVERKLDKSNYLHSRCKLDPSMFLPSNYAFTLAINIIIFLVLYKLHSVNGPLYLFALWPSPLPYCARECHKSPLDIL